MNLWIGAPYSIYIKLTRICEETNMSLALPIVVQYMVSEHMWT
jgi:hypothetical protein